jgi:hypothetical protein
MVDGDGVRLEGGHAAVFLAMWYWDDYTTKRGAPGYASDMNIVPPTGG